MGVGRVGVGVAGRRGHSGDQRPLSRSQLARGRRPRLRPASLRARVTGQQAGSGPTTWAQGQRRVPFRSRQAPRGTARPCPEVCFWFCCPAKWTSRNVTRRPGPTRIEAGRAQGVPVPRGGSRPGVWCLAGVLRSSSTNATRTAQGRRLQSCYSTPRLDM